MGLAVSLMSLSVTSLGIATACDNGHKQAVASMMPAYRFFIGNLLI
jgi:hypothetical protein